MSKTKPKRNAKPKPRPAEAEPVASGPSEAEVVGGVLGLRAPILRALVSKAGLRAGRKLGVVEYVRGLIRTECRRLGVPPIVVEELRAPAVTTTREQRQVARNEQDRRAKALALAAERRAMSRPKPQEPMEPTPETDEERIRHRQRQRVVDRQAERAASIRADEAAEEVAKR